MKKISEFVLGRLVAGALVVAPTYLAVLLVLKGIKSLAGIMKPFAQLLPKWLPADQVLSLLVVLVGCFLIGMALRTRIGYRLWNRVEKSFFDRMPGYALIRSLTQPLAGEEREAAWKPALAEVEEALVPAFIIEELGDGRFTVFVPSIPTGGSGVHLECGAGASAECAVHTGDQNDLALGIGIEGFGGGDGGERKVGRRE